MYVVTVRFEVDSLASGSFLARVRQQAADSLKAEPGCHRFDICVDPDAPERVFLYELYDDVEAFQAHLATAHFLAFDREVGPVVREKRVETYMLA